MKEEVKINERGEVEKEELEKEQHEIKEGGSTDRMVRKWERGKEKMREG